MVNAIQEIELFKYRHRTLENLQLISMRRKEHTKNQALATLSKDHHFISLFCWKIKRGLHNGIPVARISDYVRYYWEEFLDRHFKDEEKFLFIPSKSSRAERAIREHKIIRKHIEELFASEEKQTRKMLLQLTELLEEHIQYEKRSLFPMLERKLERTSYQIDQPKIKERSHPTLLYQYKDEFWNS